MELGVLKTVFLLSFVTFVAAGGESVNETLATDPPKSIAPVFLCTNVADAFRAGSYVKSYCLVSTNLNFDAAAENCNRLGLKPYEPMPIEDPLFFFMNGNQQPYAETQQVFITKTDDIDPEFNLYCTGYFLFRGLYQKSAVDCEIPSFSFCEFKKAIAPSQATITVPTTPAPARP